MSVKISDVKRFSLCWLNGIKAGDSLVRINGKEIEDVLDYDFYMNDLPAVLTFETSKGKEKNVKITEKNTENVGLEFKTYL